MLFLKEITANPLLSPKGAYLCQARLRRDLIEMWGLFEKGGLINLPKWGAILLFQTTRRWYQSFIKN